MDSKHRNGNQNFLVIVRNALYTYERNDEWRIHPDTPRILFSKLQIHFLIVSPQRPAFKPSQNSPDLENSVFLERGDLVCQFQLEDHLHCIFCVSFWKVHDVYGAPLWCGKNIVGTSIS